MTEGGVRLGGLPERAATWKATIDVEILADDRAEAVAKHREFVEFIFADEMVVSLVANVAELSDLDRELLGLA